MTLLEFIQLLLRNKRWVLAFPVLVTVVVFFLTKGSPKSYTSQTIIYTGIASGFNPDNDYENKVDYHAVNSRFDNLINIIGSRETRRDVGLTLLAYMIHNTHERENMLSGYKDKELAATMGAAFIKKYKKEDLDATKAFLQKELEKGHGNEIYNLLYGESKNPFNVKSLTDVKADRIGLSDMLKIEYTCLDGFTCKKTLDLVSSIFLKKYQTMRIGEADQAVKYFEEQTAIAKTKLQFSEQNLKHFRSANGVINYYEQTKYIADQKEQIDQTLTDLEMQLKGFETALASVEDRISKRFLVQLQSEKIVQVKNDLSKQMAMSGLSSVKYGTLLQTTPDMEAMKKMLKSRVDTLYALNNTVEGLPSKALLEEWLKLTVSKEETDSKLGVLLKNRKEFEKIFDRYAPMGSELSKLEREVETAEKEYLNLLHNLNQAILRENNLRVSENVSVIDEAALPLVPNPSKRVMLLIASLLGCTIMTIVVLVVRQYLDNTLASPLNFEKVTGIQAATAFMTQKIFPEAKNEMDRRSLVRWEISLKEILHSKEDNTVTLAIPFNCPASMTNEYLSQLQQYLIRQKHNLQLVTEEDGLPNGPGNYLYELDKIHPEQVSLSLLEKANLLLLFFDANECLDEYQAQTMENWKKLGIPVKGVLVNTQEQYIIRYLGEIPRKRSKLRMFVKRTMMRYVA
ncbi:MAG: GNVR domain-containing protein [Chitinophagales bacterium]|nr:GNVR domain-containing protein [Chitinophagales bacterium]